MWLTLRQMQSATTSSGVPRRVTFRNLDHPFLIRPGTTDVLTSINNIIREEYGQFQPDSDPQWMIDAGAYIGDTSAYFLSRFPNLKVIALEPNPPSYEMALQNLQPYGERALLLKKGLWDTDQFVRFSGNSTGASIQDTGFEIECLSIPTILNKFSISRLNILKMDIEGAEEVIFSKNPERWLDCVDLLIVEIHGQHIKDKIYHTLKEHKYIMRQFRSVWYCQREE